MSKLKELADKYAFKIPKENELQPWQKPWCSMWENDGKLVKVIDWDYKNQVNIVCLGADDQNQNKKWATNELAPYTGTVKMLVWCKRSSGGVMAFDNLTRQFFVDAKTIGGSEYQLIGPLNEISAKLSSMIKAGEIDLRDTFLTEIK